MIWPFASTAVTTTLHPPTRQVRLTAEQQIRGCGLDWTILRPTMIYGAVGDRNMSRLLRLLGRAPVLPVPATGARLHQPVHVADVAAAVVAALHRPAAIGSLYNVAGPEPLPFADLLRICARVEEAGVVHNPFLRYRKFVESSRTEIVSSVAPSTGVKCGSKVL